MSVDPHDVVRKIHDVGQPSGHGRTLLIVAGERPLYAGIHRPPAKTLLEAILTILAHPSYRDILVFSGDGDHLPAYDLGRAVLGRAPCGWFYRGVPASLPLQGAPPQPAIRSEQEDLALGGLSAGVLKDLNLIDTTKAAEDRVFLEARHSSDWCNDKLGRLLGEIEEKTGVVWDGKKHVPQIMAASVQRALVLVDAAFLEPHDTEQPGVMPDQLRNIAHRFSSIPDLAASSDVDVVLFCEHEEQARAIVTGNFPVCHRTDMQGQQTQVHRDGYPQLCWRGHEILVFPSAQAVTHASQFLTGDLTAISLYRAMREQEAISPASPLSALDRFVGMQSVRRQLEKLQDEARLIQFRREAGLPVPDKWLHTMLEGPPGTGKTEVAKVIGRIYSELGLISGAKFTQVTRGKLVGEFVGTTAPRTIQVCREALGGVLFVDEAYQLAEGGENDFGREALGELLTWMAEHRGDLVVIFAGYPGTKRRLGAINEGLDRRIGFDITFEDYTNDELLAIAHRIAEKVRGDRIEPGSDEMILELLKRRRNEVAKKSGHFGNAGEVEKLLDAASRERARRLREVTPTGDDLTLLSRADFGALITERQPE